MFKGERLKKLRTERGLSCEQLKLELYREYRITVARETINGWENGGHTPNSIHLFYLSKYFKKPMEYFFGRIKK